MPTRRALLAGLLAAPFLPRIAVAGRSTGDARLVVLVLRGGMDGLGAVPATGDPDFARARGTARGPDGGLALDGTFALHPALAPLAPLWEARQLAVVHAVGTPYRERSHFDGQDVLETGRTEPMTARSGWLNRALLGIDAEAARAMALGRTVPRLLQGDAPVTSADPTREVHPADPFLAQVADLYRHDAAFDGALQDALRAQAMLGRVDVAGRGRARADAGRVSAILGGILADPEGPRVAVAELSGWDTHTGQDGALARQLDALARSLAALAEASGEAWRHTVVCAVSEFGRTVAGNGTGGTDHGTGGALLLAGGAVRGGRVVTDWPGLRERDLLDGRDLRPTLDVRQVFAGLLRDHLGVPVGHLQREVFPDAPAALDGLVA